jgi:GxxExxY protein
LASPSPFTVTSVQAYWNPLTKNACATNWSRAACFRRQAALPVVYKSVRLECGYRMDIVVEDQVIIELKTVERLPPIHEAQMLTYLKLSGIRTGLLLNFNVPVLKDGIRRMLL